MHTHTNFCDGKNTPREMVEAAIEQGCTTLGFSGHSYSNVNGIDEWGMGVEAQRQYIEEISALKEEYRGRIEILLGIEQDYYSPLPERKYDYVIGSVHGVKTSGGYFNVDNTFEELKGAVDAYYGGDVMGAVKDYYTLVADVVNKTDCDIIGHFDLITKFNKKNFLIDTSSEQYRSIALEALDALIPAGRLFEINTGAMSRGYKTKPYPEDFILRRIAERGADVIITGDSHRKDTILYGFEDAVEYARSCGVKHICVYKNSKIEKISI